MRRKGDEGISAVNQVKEDVLRFEEDHAKGLDVVDLDLKRAQAVCRTRYVS